ncbi:hypothetical protein [Mycoplasma todarodis]|uniref:hypothetical protein n=1 Tax=Mycoplasma todarodis TaxID=1937191 RepID=UPI003B3240FA
MQTIDKELKAKFYKRIAKAICKCKNFTKCNCKTTKMLNVIETKLDFELNKAGKEVLFYEQEYTKKVSVKTNGKELTEALDELAIKTIEKLKEVKLYRFDFEE